MQFGGWDCHFCGMEWEQPASEVNALAWLQQHRGAWQEGRHPPKGGEKEGWGGVADLAERDVMTLGFPWGRAWLCECPSTGQSR